ncbi:tRNA-dihydrouridine synthase 2 [Mucor circinelloides]
MSVTHPDIDYANKAVLAPMVRIGTLPMRLVALDYGADLVWSEELVDKRIIGSVRSYNPATGTINYTKGKSLTFSTHPAEKGKVILQLGTADADLALKAALTLKEDVAAVDVNCGCPKKFSVQGGMGAALLSNPDRLREILTKLVQHSGMPVTCKIRLLDTKEKTLDLVRMIASTGVKALTVHCRTKEQRSTEKPNWEALKDIVQVVKSITDIPVIVNGDVFQWSDVEKAKQITNADSVMIARGAQWNPSAFRKEGLLPFETVVRTYIKKAIDMDNLFQNTKYVLLSMNTEDTSHTRSELYTNVQRSKSMLRICELFDLVDYYNDTVAKHKLILDQAENTADDGKREREEAESAVSVEPVEKKQKTD